jgi:hypothetical protein
MTQTRYSPFKYSGTKGRLVITVIWSYLSSSNITVPPIVSRQFDFTTQKIRKMLAKVCPLSVAGYVTTGNLTEENSCINIVTYMSDYKGGLVWELDLLKYY